jgi:hypothetical protein
MFCGFIWSPIFDHYYNILEEINRDYNVKQFYIYDFNNNPDIYEKAILKIYTTDDIDPDKVKNVKLKYMEPYNNKFIYFLFDVNNPTYRTKKKYCTKICIDVENTKKNVRNNYKKYVKNYIHDIIIHTSDNPQQAKDIAKIMKSYNQYKINQFINLKTLLKFQYNDVFPNGKFTRIDMLVRAYSIKKYLDDNKYDFSLYKKMQELRAIYLNCENKQNCEIFKELIKSLSIKYDNLSKIKCVNNFILSDGSHRLSYCYLKKKIFIPFDLIINPEKTYCNYDINWFKERFNLNEIKILENEIKILEDYLK